MKATFLQYTRPLLTAMVQDTTPADMICTIEQSLYDGAEAFGIQLENLEKQYRTDDQLRYIFSYCEGKPIYITSYRYGNSADLSDEELAEYLVQGIRCGATLADVMGDFFHPEKNELTFDAEAIQKQKDLIARIHALGGEVLISSHLHAFFTEEQVISFAKEQERRGADIAKIVSFAENEEQLLCDLGIAAHLKNELKVPYLFLANGASCKLLRQVGPALGVCMYLCVDRYRPYSSKEQPLLRAMREVRDRIM